MSQSAADQLQRVQRVLATTHQDYDALCYVFLEGAVEVTVRSAKSSVTVPFKEDLVGSLNMELAQVLFQRIQALEQEVMQWREVIIKEYDEDQLRYVKRPSPASDDLSAAA